VFAILLSGLYWVSLFVLVFAVGDALEVMNTGKDAVHEPIGQIQMAHSHIVKYLVNPGAFGSYSVQIDEERPILPGLIWVRHLMNERGQGAIIKVVDSHHIRCQILDYDKDGPETEFEIY
jgi:hypothetical protein